MSDISVYSPLMKAFRLVSKLPASQFADQIYEVDIWAAGGHSSTARPEINGG